MIRGEIDRSRAKIAHLNSKLWMSFTLLSEIGHFCQFWSKKWTIFYKIDQFRDKMAIFNPELVF